MKNINHSKSRILIKGVIQQEIIFLIAYVAIIYLLWVNFLTLQCKMTENYLHSKLFCK